MKKGMVGCSCLMQIDKGSFGNVWLVFDFTILCLSCVFIAIFGHFVHMLQLYFYLVDTVWNEYQLLEHGFDLDLKCLSLFLFICVCVCVFVCECVRVQLFA